MSREKRLESYCTFWNTMLENISKSLKLPFLRFRKKHFWMNSSTHGRPNSTKNLFSINSVEFGSPKNSWTYNVNQFIYSGIMFSMNFMENYFPLFFMSLWKVCFPQSLWSSILHRMHGKSVFHQFILVESCFPWTLWKIIFHICVDK